jgi:hypothetical protein
MKIPKVNETQKNVTTKDMGGKRPKQYQIVSNTLKHLKQKVFNFLDIF